MPEQQPQEARSAATRCRRRTFSAYLTDGRGVRWTTAPFNLRRWRRDAGFGGEGDGQRWRRLRCLQTPIGLVSVLGRWQQHRLVPLSRLPYSREEIERMFGLEADSNG